MNRNNRVGQRLLVGLRTFIAFWVAALAAVSCTGAEPLQHRGIWMHPEQFKTPQLADHWIERIEAAHLNVIYPLVWYHGGTAWFKTKLSPMAKDLPEGFDPLAYLVKRAHARGIDVHAWFVNGNYGSAATPGLFVEHPDWRLQGGRTDGIWFDLGKPEVRNFERDVMVDCLRNYGLDGLHFDYIRYGGQGICYCEHCQDEFSRKFGELRFKAGEDRFPALLELAANRLGQPTTAQVLATFEDGKPALTINKLGEGESVLLNWEARGSAHLAVENFVKQTLARFGSTNLFQLHTTQTAAKYRLEEQEKAATWLRGLSFPTRLINETALAKVPRNATVVLNGQYYIDQETIEWLENFVRDGGHCLVIDGPVFAIKSQALQRVLGLKSSAPYYHGWKMISPAPGQDLLKPGPPMDAEKERQRLARWVEYRKWTVSELVRAVYRDAKAVKPQAWISAAVFFDRASADGVCQDWYGWLREGCIDYVLPMAYTPDNKTLAKAFAEWKLADPNMERIIPGLSIYSVKDGKVGARDVALVRSQLDVCKTNSTHGNLFFALSYLNEPLTKALVEGPFAEPAQPWYPPRR